MANRRWADYFAGAAAGADAVGAGADVVVGALGAGADSLLGELEVSVDEAAGVLLALSFADADGLALL